MPLTLEQYASYLDTRNDLSWPAAPAVETPKAKTHLKRLPEVRVVLWNVYGTLLAIPGGELYFRHPKDLMMTVALDKTLQEFKMWGSMSRKPGQPSEYLGVLYGQELTRQQGISLGGETHPEMSSQKLWEAIIKKLLQKDYAWDTGFYGSLNQLSEKVAYFFHASLQGVGCYHKAARALLKNRDKGVAQGLLADGQCFTRLQLQRGLHRQDPGLLIDGVLPEERCFLSHSVGARKPSKTLFETAWETLKRRGFDRHEILHVGSHVDRDVIPARKLGMRTALFAGDKSSLLATTEQLKNDRTRPDVMITALKQVAEIVG